MVFKSSSIIMFGFLLIIASQKAIARTSQLITHEHIIETISVAPSLMNKKINLYLREVKNSKTRKNTANAVLFIHGSGWPAEVDFDTPFKDYSWMAYLASSGFDTYALDLTGYGRSTRPEEMNNLCNLAEAQQQQFIPALIPGACASVHAQPLTTPESDLHDIDEAANFILRHQQIKSVSIIGWSLAGFRSLSYTLANSGKINRLVLLAPTYVRSVPSTNPLVALTFKKLTNVLDRQSFIQEWDEQTKCNNQFSEEVRNVVWSELMAADPIGATWGQGVSRSPVQAWNWGLNKNTAATFSTPTLIVAGEFDTLLQSANELYEDLTIAKKKLITLGCSSHNAIWEKNHLLLFRASKEWLQTPIASDLPSGKVKLGF